MASPEQIASVRLELGDTDVGFPILTDSEYSYFIDKNNGSVRRSIMDCAKTILLKLSMRSDETVDIFTIRGSRVAEQYREALKLIIRDPNLNPALTIAQVFAGGISLSDMKQNLESEDTNAVTTPLQPKYTATNFFEV
jgi:pantoate kinase